MNLSNTPARPLPMRIDEITADWLTEALHTRAPGVTVNAFEVIDVNPGTCTKIRLRLDLDDAGMAAGIPELVILKGGFEEHSRAMWHIHQSEVRGYSEVYTALPLPVPRCFFAEYADDQQQGIVIMEDLVALGVEFCDALRPQSFEQVGRRLGVLAEFHARTWDSPELTGKGRWAHFRQSEESLRSYMDMYLLKPEEWQRFVAAPRGAAISVAFHDLQLMIDLFDRLVIYSKRLPQCLLHGDTHPNNLYIYPDGTPGFFDSLPGRGPGMREVTYHMVCALDLADRPRWEGALIQHYLAELARHGVKPPSFEEAMDQYAAHLLHGHIIFTVNESFYQPEAANTAYTARFGQAMLDHDTIGVLSGIS